MHVVYNTKDSEIKYQPFEQGMCKMSPRLGYKLELYLIFCTSISYDYKYRDSLLYIKQIHLLLFFSLFWNHLKQFIKKVVFVKIENACARTHLLTSHLPMISSVLYDNSSLISDLRDQMKNAKISPYD